ncbi:MAG TPA: polysaccharide biosynthesis tyrosine autokinase, partial [Chitinophagaceae bacterium]|nr:polysaccharide biosynthesis tyrosine autokinase [Chitinophagaceae bacterium]
KETSNANVHPAILLTEKSQIQDLGPDKSQEIALLTSTAFIYRTLKSLDFRISYFKEGTLGKDEMYDHLPFKISIPDTALVQKLEGKRFKISFPDKLNFEIAEIGSGATNSGRRFPLGQRLSINGCPLMVNLTTSFSLNDDVNKDFEFRVNNLQELAGVYKGKISIFQEDDESSVFQVQLTTAQPKQGIAFLNAYTKQYIEEKYEEKSRSAAQALGFINDQINSIRSSLGSAETNLASFQAANTYSDAAGMAGRNMDAITQLENERAVLSVNERYYSSILQDLNSNNNLDRLVAPSTLGIQDGLTDGLVRQLTELQIEKNSYTAGGGGAKNPLVQDIDVKISNVKAALKENLRNLSNNNRVKLGQIAARTNQFQANMYSLPRAERKFTDIKRSADFNEGIYLFLMQKRVEAGILKASATVENKVIEPAALLSSVPLSPKKVNNYALAVLVGLAIPFSFIKIKDALNKKVAGKDEILSYTSIPVVGTIYRNLDASPFVIDASSRTAVSESFRILRSNIIYFAKERSKKVFLFSSTDSGEGKSFTSTNVAFSFALTKKKTVLVNLDLRVPSKVYKEIDHGDSGVSSFLNGDASIKDIIQSTSNPYLHFISTGELPINPAELLMENRLEDLFVYLRANYDYVIIDTPPLGIVADTFIIAKYSDINVIVVREKYSLKERLSELEDMYKDHKLENMCMVINDIRLDKKGYTNAYYYKSKASKSILASQN